MIVVNISNVPPKLRGFLTKYLWEINAGIYVGNVNARIRDKLWSRIEDNIEDGRATMVFPAKNEQGFDFYTLGSAWKPVDLEGLKLIIRPKENRISVQEMPKSTIPEMYTVLDLETTGLDVNNDRIIEIGALRMINGEKTESFNRIIKTEIPQNIIDLTGITQGMADKGVDIKEALKDLDMFIADSMTVGFNIRMFDLKILKKECARCNITVPVRQITDVYEMVKKKISGIKSYRLCDVADYFGITTDDDPHRALTDCVLCDKIYKACLIGADRDAT